MNITFVRGIDLIYQSNNSSHVKLVFSRLVAYHSHPQVVYDSCLMSQIQICKEHQADHRLFFAMCQNHGI